MAQILKCNYCTVRFTAPRIEISKVNTSSQVHQDFHSDVTLDEDRICSGDEEFNWSAKEESKYKKTFGL